MHKNEKVEIELSFSSKSPLTLRPKTSRFYLDIISGPSYLFVVRATSRIPRVSFSLQHLDFGPIFVMKNSIKRVIELEIVNYESKTMNIETTFTKTPYLDVQISPGEILLPNKSEKTLRKSKKTRFKSKPRASNKAKESQMRLPRIRTISNKHLGPGKLKGAAKNKLEVKRIPIVFSPRDVRKYKEKITFIINNNHEMQILVEGEGCRFILDVIQPTDDLVDFGSVLVGKEVHRKFVLKNNSRRMIPIDFDVKGQLRELANMGITLSPNKALSIDPKEEKTFYLRFKPHKRLTSIKTGLLYKYDQDEREVFKSVEMVGSSQGFEIKIVEDTLSFGDVVVGSSLLKALRVSNIGDINAHFRWDLSSCARDFTIAPVKGVLNSSDDVSFSVTFHPKDFDDILHKVRFFVEGFPQATSIVTLVGRGVNTENGSIINIEFETSTRTLHKRDIEIKVGTCNRRTRPSSTGKSSPITVSNPKKSRNTFTGPTRSTCPAKGRTRTLFSTTPRL